MKLIFRSAWGFPHADRGLHLMIEKENLNQYGWLQQNKKLKALFLILFSLVTFAIAYVFRNYFWPFLFALIFYIVLKPVNDWLLTYVKKRAISSSLLIISFVGIVLVPLFLLLFAIGNQSYEFYQYIEKQFNPDIFSDFFHRSRVMKYIYYYFNITEGEVIAKLSEMMQKVSMSLFSRLTNVLTFSFRLVVNFFFMLLILFFFFIEGTKFTDALYKALPFPIEMQKDIINRLNEVIKVVISGNLLIMMLQGLCVGIGFYIAGVPAALMWGSIAAIFSLIPVVGTSIVWLPAVVYLLVTKEYAFGIFLGAWCMVLYFAIENILKPVVFGDRLRFHPLVFFFLLLGGIQSFGLAGVIIGPILLTLFYSLWQIYKVLEEYELKNVAGGPCAEGDAPEDAPLE